MTASGSSETKHVLELDGLRAISILLVLAAHLLPIGPKWLRLNELAGGMGMSLFFALSGFLIASTLLSRPDVIDFAVRRTARILPLAYGYMFLMFVFFTLDFVGLLYSFGFTINYFTQYLEAAPVAHLWSLCVEMHFYAAIALVVLTFGRKGVYLVWPACLAVTLLRIQTGTYYSIFTHLRVDEILAGACVATIVHAYGRRPLLYTHVLPLAFLLHAATSSPHAGWLQYLRPYGSAAVLAVTLWTLPGAIHVLLRSKPARYIANISYALYVFHPLTAYGWMNDGSTATRYLLKRPVSFALTFVLAHLSTYHWENHFRKWASNWLARRRARLEEREAGD